MIILNLGVDNSGKTTLSKKILELDKDIKYLQPLGPKSKETQMNFINAAMALAVELDNPTILYERFPLFDEIVYGKILREEPNFKMIGYDSYVEEILNMLLEVDHIIIYNNPGIEVIQRSINAREQYEGVVSNIIPLYQRYTLVARKLKERGLNVLYHNYTLEYNRNNQYTTNSILERVKEGI